MLSGLLGGIPVGGVVAGEMAGECVESVCLAEGLRAGRARRAPAEEQVTAVVSHTHPWAAKPTLAGHDLLEEEIICMGRGTGMPAAYEAMMQAEGHPAPVAWEVTLPSTVRALAERGLGVGIVTSSLADPADDLVHLPIRSKHATSQLGVVWRDEPPPGPPTEAVLTALRTQLATPGDLPPPSDGTGESQTES